MIIVVQVKCQGTVSYLYSVNTVYQYHLIFVYVDHILQTFCDAPSPPPTFVKFGRMHYKSMKLWYNILLVKNRSFLWIVSQVAAEHWLRNQFFFRCQIVINSWQKIHGWEIYTTVLLHNVDVHNVNVTGRVSVKNVNVTQRSVTKHTYVL